MNAENRTMWPTAESWDAYLAKEVPVRMNTMRNLTQNEPRYAVVTEGYAVIAESESSAEAFRLAEEAAAQFGDPFGVIDRGPRGALRGRFGGEPVWIGE